MVTYIMISHTAQSIITAIIAIKVGVSTLFFVAPSSITNPYSESSAQQAISSIPTTTDDDDGFESFIKFLQDKGMSFLTLLEAGALYFLWTVVKDTRSREDLLEKVFEGWSKDEKQMRSFGKLFRFLGVSCLALHDAGLNEILIHLQQKHTVILIKENQKDLGFYPIKAIENKVFVLELSLLYENQLTEKIPIQGDKFDILVFFEESFTLSESRECE